MRSWKWPYSLACATQTFYIRGSSIEIHAVWTFCMMKSNQLSRKIVSFNSLRCHRNDLHSHQLTRGNVDNLFNITAHTGSEGLQYLQVLQSETEGNRKGYIVENQVIMTFTFLWWTGLICILFVWPMIWKSHRPVSGRTSRLPSYYYFLSALPALHSFLHFMFSLFKKPACYAPNRSSNNYSNYCAARLTDSGESCCCGGISIGNTSTGYSEKLLQRTGNAEVETLKSHKQRVECCSCEISMFTLLGHSYYSVYIPKIRLILFLFILKSTHMPMTNQYMHSIL